jgi:hypothetical protein
MKALGLTPNRRITCDGKLWDGDAIPGEVLLLPCNDEDVRRDINALLHKCEQREMPPVKEKKAKTKKAKETKCVICDEHTKDIGIELGKKVPMCKLCQDKEVVDA